MKIFWKDQNEFRRFENGGSVVTLGGLTTVAPACALVDLVVM